MDLTARLDAMEAAIKKPSFRQSSGKANEVNYWIFDYPPEKELEVRERIEYMKNKNQKGTDEYQLVVFDLYDIIIDFLERKNFVEKCCDFEKKRGFGRIIKAVNNPLSSMVAEFDDLSFLSRLLDPLICIELFHLSYFRMYAACPQGIRARLLVSSQSTGMPEDASYSGKSLFPSVIMTISEGVLSAICSRT